MSAIHPHIAKITLGGVAQLVVGGVAQLVVASSLMLKGIGFDPG